MAFAPPSTGLLRLSQEQITCAGMLRNVCYCIRRAVWVSTFQILRARDCDCRTAAGACSWMTCDDSQSPPNRTDRFSDRGHGLKPLVIIVHDPSRVNSAALLYILQSFFPSFTTLVRAIRLGEVGNERFRVSLSSPGHCSISNLCYWEASSNLTRLKLMHWKINRFTVLKHTLSHAVLLDVCSSYREFFILHALIENYSSPPMSAKEHKASILQVQPSIQHCKTIFRKDFAHVILRPKQKCEPLISRQIG